MRGSIGKSMERNKIWFLVMGKQDLVGFLGTFSIFQLILGVNHEDLGLYFVIYSTDKAFHEEGI
jgi:hypothetical protein